MDTSFFILYSNKRSYRRFHYEAKDEEEKNQEEAEDYQEVNPAVFFGKFPVVEGAESGYADVLQMDITRHNRVVRQGGDGWIFSFAVGDPEGFLHCMHGVLCWACFPGKRPADGAGGELAHIRKLLNGEALGVAFYVYPLDSGTMIHCKASFARNYTGAIRSKAPLHE